MDRLQSDSIILLGMFVSIAASVVDLQRHIQGETVQHSTIIEFISKESHFILYLAQVFVLAFLFYSIMTHWSESSTWTALLPSGYWASFFGLIVLLSSGLLDMLWHTLFGIELGLDAMISPPHVLLAYVGAPLAAGGPLLNGWMKDHPSRIKKYVMVISAALSISSVKHLMHLIHPLLALQEPNLFVVTILFQTSVTMSIISVLSYEHDLPIGSVFIYCLLAEIGVFFMLNELSLFPGVILGSLLAEWAYQLLTGTTRGWRLSLSLIPAFVYLGFLSNLFYLNMVDYSVHVWLGIVMMAGYIGLVISYLVNPPSKRRKGAS